MRGACEAPAIVAWPVRVADADVAVPTAFAGDPVPFDSTAIPTKPGEPAPAAGSTSVTVQQSVRYHLRDSRCAHAANPGCTRCALLPPRGARAAVQSRALPPTW